jgi:hypothetical protein
MVEYVSRKGAALGFVALVFFGADFFGDFLVAIVGSPENKWGS